jgi:hypothetical protein
MAAWVIAEVSLLAYPIAALLLVGLTKKKPRIRKKVFLACFAANILALFGLLTNITTTWTAFDLAIVSGFYLTVCLLLWLGWEWRNSIIKVLSLLAMICVFGMGYISGTVGVLGIGFATNEMEPDVEKRFDDGLIYKETALGNALTDYRGKKVEVYRTIPWLPLLERRILEKDYFNVVTYLSALSVKYKPAENKIYLAASHPRGNERQVLHWADTLQLGK